jgi:hypothetical protein
VFFVFLVFFVPAAVGVVTAGKGEVGWALGVDSGDSDCPLPRGPRLFRHEGGAKSGIVPGCARDHHWLFDP